MKAINIGEKLSSFKDHWKPRQIATVDDMHVLLAKLKGEFLWHSHQEEDELFQVIKGTLHIALKDKTVTVKTGELFVVPKGVPHCPYTAAGEEVHVLLFEKIKTAHTGDVVDKRTQKTPPKI